MKPTIEQENIINAAKEGHNLAIQAYAGAAKTSTCVMVAKEVKKPSLYIAFNKDIAEEAAGKFPPHVKCQTVHSLAYKAIVKFPKSVFGKRLKSYLDINDLYKIDLWNEKFGECEDKIKMAQLVKECIISFCQSASFSILEFALENLKTQTSSEKVLGDLVGVTVSYWSGLTNASSDYAISHDIYLKMFQLNKPTLTNPDSYDLPYEVIFLDEAQDSNEVTLDIFLNQAGQKIMVGDPYQAIYEWRGAVNAFDKIGEGFKNLYLTESFRYTQQIANMASNIIGWFGIEANIKGKGDISKWKGRNNNHAVICRTNVTIIGELLAAAKAGTYVYTNVNLKELFPKIYHVAALMFGSEPMYPVAFLSQYRNWKELTEAAEHSNELQQLIKITQALKENGSVSQNINLIKKYVEPNKELASYCVISGHRSKGLEFNSVELAYDFVPKVGENQTFSDWVKDNNQEVNLIYVAVTRGKYDVRLPVYLEDLIYDN